MKRSRFTEACVIKLPYDAICLDLSGSSYYTFIQWLDDNEMTDVKVGIYENYSCDNSWIEFKLFYKPSNNENLMINILKHGSIKNAYLAEY
jgi:hypothetical protein